MKCRIVRHFIWVFTVYQSTHLGVSGPRRVKITIPQIIVEILQWVYLSKGSLVDWTPSSPQASGDRRRHGPSWSTLQHTHITCQSCLRHESPSRACILKQISDTLITLDEITKKVKRKIVNIFLPISFNICFGFSKEPYQWDGSFEYPQHMFWLWNKEINFWYTLLTKGLS